MRNARMRSAFAAMVVGLLLSGCAGGNGNDSSGPAEVTAPASPALSPSGAAGNGIADLEPAAIIKTAKATLARAKSFRYEGVVHSVGRTTTLDCEVRGSDVVGTFVAGELTIELLRVGKKSYIRPNEAFFRANLRDAAKAKTAVAVMKGRWVLVPPNDKDFNEAFSVADASNILDLDRSYTKADIQTVEGRRAIAMKEATGSDPGTLFIAIDGAPNVLRWDGGVQLGGTLAFRDFGADFSDLRLPPASETVELAALFA
jgi:hypothetical protein